MIAMICIIAPKAKMKIELELLFVKNTASGRIPRLKIKAISGIIPVKIVPYIRVNSISSEVGTKGNNIPGIKKSIIYHRMAITLPIIRRFALLSLSSFFTNILPTKNMIKEISARMFGMKGSRK
jgi:hypothetical protein